MTALGEDLRADPAPFTRAALDESLLVRWQAVVAAHRHEPAVSAPDGLLTFDELDRRADAVAAALDAGDRRVPLGELVLVLADHDAAALAAVLGIWKAGRAVAVLDPMLPAKRLRRLVTASGARWCVAGAGQVTAARAAGVAHVVDISRVEPPPSGRAAVDASVPSAPGDPDAVGQVVFTSGSTGEPRGVWYSHRFLVHDAWSRRRAGWSGPSDVVAVPLPLAYAGGFGACFGALLSGAAVHLWDPRVHGVDGVVDSQLALEPTVVVSTPSMLSAIAAGVARGGEVTAPLRLVISTGERYAACDARALLAVLPAGCRLVNVLGASETGLVAAVDVTPGLLAEGAGLPVGHPLPDKRIELVPDGETPHPFAGCIPSEGLLAVASRFTAGGYWQDEAGTAQSFQRDGDGGTVVTTGDVACRRPDGCLEVIGRRGLTVKVRGYRVEPAEVEAEIRALPRVRDAAVIGYERAPGIAQLAAYVTFEGGHGMTSSGIRRELRERLPGFMVPDVVMPLAELPRNERGKVDRTALPTPSPRDARLFEAPGTIWELIIADVWKDALGVSEVGLHDDFFELGGDSLAVEEVCSRLTDDYGLTPDSRSLVAAPTLLEFTDAVVYRRRRVASRAMVPIRATGTEPPLFCVAGGGGVGLCFLPLARRLDPDRPVWALQAHNLESAGFPDRSVARVAKRNVAELREVQPGGPYHLLGYSFGGLVAFEMAHQLRAAGEEVALLVIVDSFAPDPRHVVCEGEPRARVRRLLWRARVAASTLLPTIGRGHYIRFYRQSAALGRRYRGAPWDGETLVVTSQDEPLPGRSAEAWAAFLTGSWRSATVPGRHEAVLREPWVAALAEPLDLVLRRRHTRDR